MFDFDATKLMIVGVLALVVLGPKELPRVMRQLGQALGKMRRMAGEFQGQFMDAMREAELEDLRKEVNKLGDQAKSAVNLDVGALDPAAELRKAAEQTSSAQHSPAAPDQPFDIAPPDAPAPVTSEDIAAAIGPDSGPSLAKIETAPEPVAALEAMPETAPAETAPAKASDSFYLRPGSTKTTHTAGVELAPDEEFTFRKAPPAAEPAAASDAPRRRSARPTGA